MDTGTSRDGAVARRWRAGNVGEIGEDCGLLRRTKVEIGVLAMRSASSVSFFSTRLLKVLFDVRCTSPRRGNDEQGDDESACHETISNARHDAQTNSLTRGG